MAMAMANAFRIAVAELLDGQKDRTARG